MEEIVPAGSLDPNEVHLPGIYVQRLVLGEKYEKRIEKRTVTKPDRVSAAGKASEDDNLRERIVRKAAEELKDGAPS